MPVSAFRNDCAVGFCLLGVKPPLKKFLQYLYEVECVKTLN